MSQSLEERAAELAAAWLADDNPDFVLDALYGAEPLEAAALAVRIRRHIVIHRGYAAALRYETRLVRAWEES